MNGKRFLVVAMHPAGFRVPRKGATKQEARENVEATLRAYHYTTFMRGEWDIAEAVDTEADDGQIGDEHDLRH